MVNLNDLYKKYEKYKSEQKVLKSVVKIVQYDEALKTDVLVLDLEGLKGVIMKKDVDYELKIKSLVNFVGREVSFVVKDVDRNNGVIYCSRAEAQKVTKDDIIRRLNDGEAFDAQIVNILKYGAYVEIDGVTGLLKNTDFAEDYTAIGELLSIGDTVKVKMKKLSANGNILFEAVKKYKSPTIMDINSFEKNQIVLGVVRNIQPFGIFVQIAPNLDALCSPDIAEIEEDMKVSVRITKVDKAAGRVRGKILNIL